MRIQIVKNPADRSSAELTVQPYAELSVGELFDTLYPELKRDDFIPIISGGECDWDDVPQRHDEVIFMADTRGIETAIAIGVFVGLSGAAALIVGGLILLMAYALVGALVGLAMSAMFKPSMPSGGSFDNSRTYQWSGIQNMLGEGNHIPVVYGEHRVGGLFVEGYIDADVTSGMVENEYMNVLAALSEGPIESIDINSIQLDGKDLSAFDGATSEITLGMANQDSLSGFGHVIHHYNINGVELTGSGSAYTYQSYNSIDSAVFTVNFPSLAHITDKGGTSNLIVMFSIEYSEHGSGIWNTGYILTCTAKTRSPVNFRYRINFPHNAKWDVRIKRTTNDFTDIKDNGKSYLKSAQEYENGRCAYPYTALLGVRLKATEQISGTAPKMTVMVKGRKIADVRTGVVAYSNNPANIIYDLLTNRRYGLGRYGMNGSRINMASLRDFANFCDEQVSYIEFNEETGLFETKYEKRYEFNLVLDTSFDAVEIINKILNSCRAYPCWEGEMFKVAFDSDALPSQLFSMGSIISDSYAETFAPAQGVPNQVEARYLDEDDNYKNSILTVIDSAVIEDVVRSESVQLYGLTKQSRVRREVAYAIRKAKALRSSIEFETGIKAVRCQVGDLIYFQHDAPLYGIGGRVLNISGNVITVDAELGENANWGMRVEYADGSLKYYTGTTSGNTFTCTGGDVVVAGTHDGRINAFSAGPIGTEAKPYRVISITRSGSLKLKISAVEHISSVYSDDNGVEIIRQNYSLLGVTGNYDGDGINPPVDVGLPPSQGIAAAPPFVQSIILNEVLSEVGNISTSHVQLSWEPVVMPISGMARIAEYAILMSDDAGSTWRELGRTQGHTVFETESLPIGRTYYFCVKPYTNFGKTNLVEKSAYALLNYITTTGKTSLPLGVTSLAATASFRKNRLTFSWAEGAPEKDVVALEIWRATTNDRDTALKVEDTLSGGFPTGGISTPGVYDDTTAPNNTAAFYWVRARDTNGNFSAWFPVGQNSGVYVAPHDEVSDLIADLTGQITESQLHLDLSSRLDQIDMPTTGLLSRVAELEGSIADVNLDIADFDTAAVYAIGDIFNYSGTTYRVIATQVQPNAVPPSATYYDAIGYYTSLNDLASATAMELQDVSVQSDANTGDISTLSSNVTALTGRVTTAEGDISGNTSAISSLSTRVTSAEGTISSHSTQITALNSDMTAVEGDISVNSTAISGLSTRVTSAEGSIDSQASSILALQASSSIRTDNFVNPLLKVDYKDGWTFTANPAAFNVGGRTGVGITQARSTSIQYLSDYFEIDPRGIYEVRISWHSDGVGINYLGLHTLPGTSVKPYNPDTGVLGAVTTNPYWVSALRHSDWRDFVCYFAGPLADLSLVPKQSNATTTKCFVLEPGQTSVRLRCLSGYSLSGGTIHTTTWTAASVRLIHESNLSAIKEERDVRASETGALSSSVSSLSSTVSGHTTTISQHTTSINGINGQYTVKIDTNGKVAGIGLMNGPTGSAFEVLADQFRVVVPGVDGGAAKIPFIAGTVDGAPAVVMPASFIGDATITNAKIGNQIRSNTVGTTGLPMWELNKDGVFIIRSSTGSTILQSGGVIDYSFVGGTKPPANADATNYGDTRIANANITIGSNGVLSGGGGGQVTVGGIGAETPTGAQSRVDTRLNSTEKARLSANQTVNGNTIVGSHNKISSANIGTYMAAAAIQEAYIGNAQVGTLKIQGEAVTVPVGSSAGALLYASTSNYSQWYSVISQGITISSATPHKVVVTGNIRGEKVSNGTSSAYILARVTRNGAEIISPVDIARVTVTRDTNGSYIYDRKYTPFSFTWVDNPGAGTWTYAIQIYFSDVYTSTANAVGLRGIALLGAKR